MNARQRRTARRARHNETVRFGDLRVAEWHAWAAGQFVHRGTVTGRTVVEHRPPFHNFPRSA